MKNKETGTIHRLGFFPLKSGSDEKKKGAGSFFDSQKHHSQRFRIYLPGSL